MKIETMYDFYYLSNRIRKAHRDNPDKRPGELARELETTPKYVSKILRRARIAKFRTGPEKAKPPAPAVIRQHSNSTSKPAAPRKKKGTRR